MAIIRASSTRILNIANFTTATYYGTPNANVTFMVAVITGYDASATDSVITNVDWKGEVFTQVPAGRFRSGAFFIDIWYLANPADITYGGFTVTTAGTCTDLQAVNAHMYDDTGKTIVYENYNTNTGTGSVNASISSAATGAVAFAGCCANGGNVTSLSQGGTMFLYGEDDMGNYVSGIGGNTESGGSISVTWTYTGVAMAAYAASFKAVTAPAVNRNRVRIY